MNYHYNKLKNLFLSQSYLDSWEDYERSLNKTGFIKWDYVILTASNEEQASTYRAQINNRLKLNQLPSKSVYVVLPDPDGKRVGSGGATFNALKYVMENDPSHSFRDKRILVIHSGGDSKRVPQYSACGKLFSPVPRELPDGRGSTLFDEFIIGMSAVPSRFKEGMLVLSGDVLLLFNPLQIDAMFNGAAAISIKEHVSIGKNHGVFLNDGRDNVARFLHKQTEEHLRELGAVNEKDCVNLDTGAVLFDCNLMDALYSLVDTEEKFNEFVNESSRISFYGDFLYPLAAESTLEDYYKEAAEGTINDDLIACRKKIWDAIRGFSMKLICLSPAEFIHFGTTRELRKLVCEDVEDYSFLGWDRQVVSNRDANDFAVHNAYIGYDALVGKGSYIENSYILGKAVIGSGSVISGVHLKGIEVPENTVWHGLTLKNKKKVVRVYGVEDNPKGRLETCYLSTTLEKFISGNGILKSDLWDDDEDYLWFAKLYPMCDTEEEAQKFAGIISRMADNEATDSEISLWKAMERTSLYASFNMANLDAMISYEKELESCILSRKFCQMLTAGVYYKDALKVFGRNGITEEIYTELVKVAEDVEDSLKIRIYYALSRFMKDERCKFAGITYDVIESKCFDNIRESIYNDAISHLPDNSNYSIKENQVDVALPVRVN